MPTVNQIEVQPGVFYTPNPAHRDWTRGKSQWSIQESLEMQAFGNALGQSWLYEDEAWGFHYVEGHIDWLGLAQNHQTRVFMAKFVDGNGNGLWHGYPADHQMNGQDRPPENITAILVTEPSPSENQDCENCAR